MEEKESTMSGSPENTESGSPTPISFSGGVMSNPLPELVPSPAGTLPGDAGSSGGGGGVKKRRGRPRKYDVDGNISFAYAAAVAKRVAAGPPPGAVADTVSPPPGFSLTVTSEYGSGKRGRGRHSGGPGPGPAGNWHQLSPSLGEIFANTAGADFTPHVITVQTGEDVANKIHSLGQKGPRGYCVLSANGTISNVTIRQPGSSAGLLTYEGRFEILSLTGSYTVTEAGGVTSRTGGLSITLAGPDGRVVGGSVAGWLTAATPVQLVVGSFVPHGQKVQRRKYQRESPTAATIPAQLDTRAAEISNSHAMLHSEAGPPAVSPMAAQSHSEADDSIGSGHNLNVVSSHNTPEWNNGSEPSSQQRFYPDINVSVPGV